MFSVSALSRNVLTKTFGLALTGLVLAACDTVSDGMESLNPFVEAVEYACPEANILADASTITVYRANSPKDLLDVRYRGNFEIGGYTCEWDLDSETREGTLTMEITPVANTTRGPALADPVITVPYFVTVTDPNRQVLSKAEFDIVAQLPPNSQRLRLRDRKVIIQTPVRAEQTDQDFIVFVGFQLTPDQLDYNRAERQKQLRR